MYYIEGGSAQRVLFPQRMIPVSMKKHSSREEACWEDRLSKHQIRGWIAVSADGLQGKGSPEKVCFHRHR